MGLRRSVRRTARTLRYARTGGAGRSGCTNLARSPGLIRRTCAGRERAKQRKSRFCNGIDAIAACNGSAFSIICGRNSLLTGTMEFCRRSTNSHGSINRKTMEFMLCPKMENCRHSWGSLAATMFRLFRTITAVYRKIGEFCPGFDAERAGRHGPQTIM